MQKILHHNIPELVVYQNNVMQGYRTDQYEGHVEDLERYISGLWTLRKIRPVNNSFGGVVTVSMDQEPETFNIFTMNSPYSNMILENLYSSLYSHDPNMNPIPDLVESMIVETHNNNSNVSLNHTRFTFDIIQNATWSDGEPLTAEDIAFTFIYVKESGVYDNPAAADLGDLVDVYTPNPYRVVIEFSTESYWHFTNIAYDYIIPEHIFNMTGIPSYSEWAVWNPGFNPEDPFVTSGPFLFTEMEAGEFYELSINSDYHWNPNIIPSSPTPTNNDTTPPPFPLQEFIVVFSVSSIVTIVIGTLIIKKRFDVNLF